MRGSKMTIKSHAFSQRLMITSCIEDAVLSDSMLINEILSRPNCESKLLLMNHFNLEETDANLVVDKKLSIALFEASTLVNESVTEVNDIKSLSVFSTTKEGKQLIKKMLEKYQILIELYARKASSTANPTLFKMIGSSKRTSKAVRNFLCHQIEESREKMSKNYEENNAKVKQFRLLKLEETFSKVAHTIDLNSNFYYIDALIKVADESGQYMNKIDKTISTNVFDLVDKIKQGVSYV